MVENVLIVAILVIILGLAVWYIVRAKKKGVKCIGCPDGYKCASGSAGCSGNCGNCPGCHTDSQ